MSDQTTETILIVDDEEPVRRTFAEWLNGARLGCTILTAVDAEAALRLANQQTIDLAILDWALGAGEDGLQLLQDLVAFQPDIVAIMVTGFANQATPLDAMRMGVRDYLDKNHDLNRDTFLAAVRKQLEHIRPAKRARRLHQSLAAFRAAVEKIIPLVQSAAALTDPVPLPDAIRGLVRFLIQVCGAADGALLVRHFDPQRQPMETVAAYDADGRPLEGPWAPFAQSVAGAAVGMQPACVINDLANASGLQWQPFERGRRSLLAVALPLGPGFHAVIELFDKTTGPFTPDDARLARSAAGLGEELLRHALGQRGEQSMLLAALQAALRATEDVAAALPTAGDIAAPPPAPVLDQLRANLAKSGAASAAEQSVALAEAIRVLAAKYGEPALGHCLRLVQSVGELLDAATGAAS
ncbi:MAG: response regulator [Gemmataceae bacterium]|nr:response regulator [Gemmataceae bacterium]